MSRTTITLDRVVTLLVGLALVAAAVLAAGWWYDWWPWMPSAVTTADAQQLTERRWWPWALAGAAMLLFLLGLRWLVAHAPSRPVGDLRLPGSGQQGRLQVNAGSAVSAACAALENRHDVRRARGTVRKDRGQLVIDIRATLEPTVELPGVVTAVEESAGALTKSLERPDLFCRVRLDVASRPPGAPTGALSHSQAARQVL